MSCWWILKVKTPILIIGWREHVGLPDISSQKLTAKIDTGARTSALHASTVITFERDGQKWVRFFPPDSDPDNRQSCELPVHDIREIKNTSGVPEKRFIVRTRLRLLKRTWGIELSLASRGRMNHPLIVGRSALSEHNIAVHSGRSFLTDEPATKKSKKGRNDEDCNDDSE